VVGSSANSEEGVRLEGNVDNTLVEINFVGTDAGATLDYGNTGHGI
jgi:hypothetical protein